jgi:pyridoxine kinase
MNPPNKIAALHDLSCLGRCALTVIIPTLSVMGYQVIPVPTALLSTHTGGFTGFTFLDLTEEMRGILAHFNRAEIRFDMLYTGYFGSVEQLSLVSEAKASLLAEGGSTLVDPVLGDGGKLYSIYDDRFVRAMRDFVRGADIITPNLTEAAFLLERPYYPHPTEEEVKELLIGLHALGAKKVVITGVSFEGNSLGAAAYDSETGEISYAFTDRINGIFHGTGDIFGSSLVASILNGKTLSESIRIAMDYTYRAIVRTMEAGTDLRFGVQFERELPFLMRELDIIA